MQVNDPGWFFGVSALIVAYLLYIDRPQAQGRAARDERARAGTLNLNPTGAAV